MKQFGTGKFFTSSVLDLHWKIPIMTEVEFHMILTTALSGVLLVAVVALLCFFTCRLAGSLPLGGPGGFWGHSDLLRLRNGKSNWLLACCFVITMCLFILSINMCLVSAALFLYVSWLIQTCLFIYETRWSLTRFVAWVFLKLLNFASCLEFYYSQLWKGAVQRYDTAKLESHLTVSSYTCNLQGIIS